MVHPNEVKWKEIVSVKLLVFNSNYTGISLFDAKDLKDSESALIQVTACCHYL